MLELDYLLTPSSLDVGCGGRQQVPRPQGKHPMRPMNSALEHRPLEWYLGVVCGPKLIRSRADFQGQLPGSQRYTQTNRFHPWRKSHPRLALGRCQSRTLSDLHRSVNLETVKVPWDPRIRITLVSGVIVSTIDSLESQNLTCGHPRRELDDYVAESGIRFDVKCVLVVPRTVRIIENSPRQGTRCPIYRR